MLLSKLTNLLSFLADHNAEHASGSGFYQFTEPVVKAAFQDAKECCIASRPMRLGEIGDIILPYESMGNVDSLDLFGLDELMIFAFYHCNRGRYTRALDIGANLGLHSIVLAKCGLQVECFEPDPGHFRSLVANLRLNDVATACTAHQAAVSDRTSDLEFVRVLGNTTSSHLAGAKAEPYGKLERFSVKAHDVRPLCENIDLIKIDAEGHEDVILTSIPLERWAGLDAFVEIGTPANAAAIHRHFQSGAVRIFAQKGGWQRVRALADMPSSYREGGVFLSAKDRMDWSATPPI